MMNDYKNILVVRTDRIGDVVLTTPSLRALRKKFPNARISILVSSFTRELVDGNPDIDEIIIDDRKKANKGLFGFLSLADKIRAKKFDLAVVFHTKKRTNALCFLSGIPVRIGYENNKFGFLLTEKIHDIRPEGKLHEAEYCLNVLRSIGIKTDDLGLFLPVKEESDLWAKQFFEQNRISKNDKVIAIHAGSSDPSKMWPEEYFAFISDQLIFKYKAKVVSVGSADIRPISRKISSLCKEKIIDLTGMITLSQLISLFKRCDLLVSNDSGPVHIAAAVKTPVISIFTRNQPGINPERWRPLSERSKVVSVKGGDLAGSVKDRKNPFLKAGTIDPEELKTIKPLEVLESIDSIFKL